MNEEEFLLRISEVLESESKIGRGSDLASVDGWDSLGMLSVLEFLESGGVSVDLDELRAVKTADDLLQLAKPMLLSQ